MSEEKQREARKRLMRALPAMSIAESQAKHEAPKGVAFLGFGYVNPDGTGRLTAQFDYAPFVEDLITLLGFETIYEVDRQLEAEGS